jgi:hypothetical protein
MSRNGERNSPPKTTKRRESLSAGQSTLGDNLSSWTSGKLLSTLGDGSDTPESDAESEDDEWTTGDAVGKVLALNKQVYLYRVGMR